MATQELAPVARDRIRKAGLALYFAAALVCGFYFFLRRNAADLDLWGKMAIGALWHQTGQFPYRDVFSFTAPSAPWVDHEWGSGVLFYWMAAGLGSGSLFWLRFALFMCTNAVIYCAFLWTRRFRQGTLFTDRILLPFLVGWVLWFGLIEAAYGVTLRCQQFSFLFYVVVLWILEECRSTEKNGTLWILPALMLLWVNMHGSYVYGFAALGLYLVWALADRRVGNARWLAITMLACFAITFINPYGFDFHRQSIEGWFMPRNMIEEWRSILHPTLLFPAGILYTAYLAAWVGIAIFAWYRGPRGFPGTVLLILATGFEGVRYQKLLPLAVLTTLILGPRLAVPSLRMPKLRPVVQRALRDAFYLWLPGTLAAAAFVGCVAEVAKPGSAFPVTVPRDAENVRYPLGAMRFLAEQGSGGNVWCEFNHGQFLFWCLYPSYKVSLDGRYEAVYSSEVFDDNMELYLSQENLGILSRYPTTHVVVPAGKEMLNSMLHRSPTWWLVYEDQYDRVYSIKPPTNGSVSATVDIDASLDDFIGDLSRFKASE